MFRRRNLMIGVSLAVLGGFLSLGHAMWTEKAAAGREARETVVVVRSSVPAQRVLEQSLLQLRRIPKGTVLPGAYRSVEEAAGRVTLVPLWPGDQVIAGRTADPGELEALTAGLSPGERGVTVSVEAGTAKALHAGELVDVVAVTPSSDGLSRVTRVVPGVKVLKVMEGDDGLDAWAMLAVSPTQAQTLALAEETGKLRLALRGGADPEVVPARPSPPSPSAAGSSPGSVRPARSPKTVEVIRGVEREKP
ncbi:MAG TPA: Flp pilus assembly protein CpaB [Firmicutes bacterium]|nr:Flp pilus assembly protein CpaB [Bacillota bacterium]